MQVAKLLASGDRRSIGRSQQVVADVFRRKIAIREVVAALSHGDRLVRMRAADALEKVSVRNWDLLQFFAPTLLKVAAASDEQEIRWHAAQILPRLRLNKAQHTRAVDTFFAYLSDKSRIVQAFALTALVELSIGDAALSERVTRIVGRAAASGPPSLKARAKALRKRLAVATASGSSTL